MRTMMDAWPVVLLGLGLAAAAMAAGDGGRSAASAPSETEGRLSSRFVLAGNVFWTNFRADAGSALNGCSGWWIGET